MRSTGTVAPTEAPRPDPSPASRWRVEGGAPWFDNLASVIERGEGLLEDMLVDFAPVGASLRTQQSFWFAFQCWAVERLVSDELTGSAPEEQRPAIGVI